MYKTLSRALYLPRFRWVISAFLIGLLTFMAHSNWSDFSAVQSINPAQVFFALMAVMSLTFFNLFCEAMKWKSLVGSNQVGWRNSLRQVIAGIGCGFLTPNRIGEFAGRRLYLPAGHKYKALTLTAVGGSIQGGVTFLFGLLGLASFPLPPLNHQGMVIQWYWLVLIAFAIPVLFLGFLKRWQFTEEISASLRHLRDLPHGRSLVVLFWAVLRYIVFSSQFVLALVILGYEGSVAMCYSGVFLLYLCQSYLPGASFGELGVREVLAVLIFSASMPGPLLAALAGFLLWLSNILIPVFIGSLSYGFGRISLR